MMEIKIGDDITVGGKVTALENGCIKLTTATGTSLWVMPKDIKTHRPVGKGDIADMLETIETLS